MVADHTIWSELGMEFKRERYNMWYIPLVRMVVLRVVGMVGLPHVRLGQGCGFHDERRSPLAHAAHVAHAAHAVLVVGGRCCCGCGCQLLHLIQYLHF